MIENKKSINELLEELQPLKPLNPSKDLEFGNHEQELEEYTYSS